MQSTDGPADLLMKVLELRVEQLARRRCLDHLGDHCWVVGRIATQSNLVHKNLTNE